MIPVKTWFDKNYYLPVCKFRGKKENLTYPAYASLKIDGELQYIINREDKILSVNKPKYGRYRENYPALDEFSSLNLPRGVYLAELFWNEGRVVEDRYALMSNKESNQVKLALFGILQYGDNKEVGTEKTYDILSSVETNHLDHLRVAPFWKIDNEDELRNLASFWVEDKGYEGLVVRREDAFWKDWQTIKFVKVKSKSRLVEEKTRNGAVLIFS